MGFVSAGNKPRFDSEEMTCDLYDHSMKCGLNVHVKNHGKNGLRMTP